MKQLFQFFLNVVNFFHFIYLFFFKYSITYVYLSSGLNVHARLYRYPLIPYTNFSPSCSEVMFGADRAFWRKKKRKGVEGYDGQHFRDYCMNLRPFFPRCVCIPSYTRANSGTQDTGNDFPNGLDCDEDNFSGAAVPEDILRVQLFRNQTEK